MSNSIHPFNNDVESGLRALILLVFGFPKKIDLSKLTYLDYVLVHSGDFDPSLKSVHAPTPHRTEEIYIRRNLLEEGLKFYANLGLVVPHFLPNGIYYTASDNAEPFLDSLSEEYTILLKKRADWAIKTFGELDVESLKKQIAKSAESKEQDIAFEVNFIHGAQ